MNKTTIATIIYVLGILIGAFFFKSLGRRNIIHKNYFNICMDNYFLNRIILF